jgi:LPS-assembly protein
MLLGLAAASARAAQEVRIAAGSEVVRLEADQQRKEGDLFIAEGHAEVQYRGADLRADRIQYNSTTDVATAQGHVVFVHETQRIEAEQADYNVRTGLGKFEKVHGVVTVHRKPNGTVLVTTNPLAFVADEVDRTGENVYVLHHAWLTVCDPARPKWKFYSERATLRVNRRVALVNANFRLFRIPLLYLPYATAPAGQTMRQSGFLIPSAGNSSIKGFTMGDSYYWAPNPWSDVTLGATYLSKRGWQENGEFRIRPSDNITISGTYFGVEDRGLPGPNGTRIPEGGTSTSILFNAHLAEGWHAVADINTLTSFTFRLAFAPTFGEAVNSEVQSTAFLSNSFNGLSVNFAADDYKDFLTAEPETSIELRSAPEARISLQDRAPWRNWPIYFGFDLYGGAVSRSDPNFKTPAMVQRAEFSPRVTVPLHWGPWLGVTGTYAYHVTHYGSQDVAGVLVGNSLNVSAGELTVDLRPPSLERIWDRGASKWKHTIEPDVTYRYVSGVDDFGEIIRFDQDDTITDTNEFDFSLTQRLFHRTGDSQAEELVSWRIEQKYYFDPTFGGALVSGARNVFEALDSVTPFAFADEPRHVSPLVNDVVITPGGAFDAELRTDFDTQRDLLTTAGALLKMHPYQQLNLTMAYFSLDNGAILQPPSNQIRMMAGYGDQTRKGWSGSLGFSYDIKQQYLQNQLVEVSYNGSCCGLSVEYARLALGPLRTENQFRFALTIANIGTFGNVRRQDKIF